MNSKHRMYIPALSAAAAIILLGSACTDDWGQADPPAGVSTAPKLENVATYDFEGEALDPVLFKVHNKGDQTVVLTEDENKGQVLDVNNGWVEMNNPLKAVQCQTAASLTFWVRQKPEVTVDEEGNETVAAQDLTSPFFTFVNENGTQSLKFTANGWLDYDGVDGEYSENNPADYATGYFKSDYWNYVALTVREDGYDLYVDGMKKVSKNVTNFDCSKMVAFMNNATTFTIGSEDGQSRFLIDDVKLYRNALTAKEIARTRLKGEEAVGGSGSGPDLSKWILVGEEDNSSNFWSAWAPYVTLKGDGQIHYEFYNYNGGTTLNYCNWLICFANAERGADGYYEYAVYRSDAFGWGGNYNGDSIVHDYNWDTFNAEMDGALVNIEITRTGENVDVVAVIHGTSGAIFNYKFSFSGVTSEELVTFLFVEKCHLLLNPEGCFIGTRNEPALAVGPDDFSAAWWSIWSPLEVVKGDYENFGYVITNHEKDPASNWNNWVLVCTNGLYVGADGYFENFVLRSDAYGWGDCYNGDNITHGYNWDTFTDDMRDAKVVILTQRDGDYFEMVARTTKTDGTSLPEYRFNTTIGTDRCADLGFFFVLDGNWLEIHNVGFFPLLSMSPEN